LAQEEDDEVEVLDSVRDERDEVIEAEEVNEFELDVEADNEEVAVVPISLAVAAEVEERLFNRTEAGELCIISVLQSEVLEVFEAEVAC
jgi:hypothetical protein